MESILFKIAQMTKEIDLTKLIPEITPCKTYGISTLCLKYYFITALILTHFNPNFKYIIKTDSSDYILKKVLSQYNKNGKLYLVAFFS